jgi:hypothetical protein
MYPGFNTISPLEAEDLDKTVIQNRKEFLEGFERGIFLIGCVFLTSYILTDFFQLRSVHAVDNFQEAVKNAELQPTKSIEKAVVVSEIVRRNRHFNLNVVLGALAALLLSFLAYDTIRETINLRGGDQKLTQLAEGVIEISKAIDKQQENTINVVKIFSN